MKNIKTFENYFGQSNDMNDMIKVDGCNCTDEKLPCVNCSSEGRDREACDVCKGTGFIENPDFGHTSECDCDKKEKED